MTQKKVGFTDTSNIQGDKLIVNNGLTSSINFTFAGGSGLSFSLPTSDGSAGWAIITNGAGVLSFGTVSGAGNVQGGGTSPKIAYWTGTSSLGSSLLEEGSGQLLFPSGTITNPGISFLTDTNTGLRRPASDQVTVVGNGQDLATFKSTGVQVGAVNYINTDGQATYVLATDGAGQTYWTENIIGTTGATGPTGSYITGGYSVGINELVFTLNTGGTVSVTGSFAGTSGTSGTSGSSGQDGTSGTSGQNGSSGTSGTSGTSGSSGQNGTSGSSGQNGTSGTSGSSGTSGTSGQNGTSGSSGVSGGTGSVDALFIDGWLNTASYSTQITALTNNSNWTAGNTFSGSISGTYQGQRYYSNPYIYDAIADNQWTRTTIGLGVTGAAGTAGTSGTRGTSGTSGSSGMNGSSGTSGSPVTEPFITLTDAATIAWTYSLGANAKVTINGNRSLSISGAANGDYGLLLVTQGPTGSYRINFGANDKFSTGTYSFSTVGTQSDIYTFVYDGSNYYWNFSKNYF